MPCVCTVSAKFTPAASTRSTTSFRAASATGSGMSRNSRTSGPPRLVATIAFMEGKFSLLGIHHLVRRVLMHAADDFPLRLFAQIVDESPWRLAICFARHLIELVLISDRHELVP